MSSTAWQEWFERVWADREERIFPQLFGPCSRGIFTLTPATFEPFKQPSLDPRWLTYGVIEFQPTPVRSSWLYVTSGMSNAWEDDEPNPDGPSGLGSEFVLETTEQAEWAILRLQHLTAFQILTAHGRYPGHDPVRPYARIAQQGPINFQESELRWLILAPPVSFESEFALESGWVELHEAFGATEDEAGYARKHGGDKLVEILTRAGAFPVTDPRRHSAVPADLTRA